MRHRRYTRGQSVVDILIALALITLSIGFAAILVFSGQQILVDRDSATEARVRAEEGMSAARLILQSGWSNISDGTYGIEFTTSGEWIFNGTSDTEGIYSRVATIRTISENEKEVDVTVSWLPSPSRPLNVEFVTVVTNWPDVVSTGGDTGGGGVSGDWQHPRTLGQVDLGPGNSGTDLDVKNKIVYMSADAADAKKPDFFVIDATNGDSPFILSSLDVGSKGLNALDVAGNYAYAANVATNGQFTVIDITNNADPGVIANLGLPGSAVAGQSIFYESSKVYIGTKKNSSGSEFFVIDVATPSSPSVVGSMEINADVNKIHVRGGYVYLATSDDGEELKILDARDPANLTEIGFYDASGTADGKSASVVTSTLYIGRMSSTNNDLYVLNIENPGSPQVIGTGEIGTDVIEMAARDYLLFMGTSEANTEFQVWNISDPQTVTLWSTYNFPQNANGIDFEDNIVYVAVRSNDALRIITSSP